MTTTIRTRVPAGASPAAAAPSASGPRARRAARRRQLTAAGVLMTPFFVLLVTVFLIPVGTAVYLSFFSDDQPGLGFGPERTVFVGLRSYAAVLTDPTFLGGLGTVALYCLIYIPLMVVGALALALLLDSGVVRLRAFAQLGLFLPHAVPGIIAALIWLYLYTPGISPVIELFAQADVTIDFLGVHTVVPSIVNIALWSNLGYNMVVFYAALQAVPREVIEASVVDGAGPVRTALQVKTPLVRASIVMVSIFTLIWALQLFTEPMLLSQSSPMISSRFSPSMYIYDAAFTRNNYGLAAAASVVLLVCTIALSYGVTRFTSRADVSREAR
ncbi:MULTISPECIES: carbohydrate ABC transporter permease [Streptomyces]|jgi:multiple sugar transport system permease protein|uniref:Carbohydrate ABC transporter permease n=3 Tax=Streptomyces TaxID=1883 RepID=A0AAX3ZTC7_STRRO|nr:MULTISPECIES: sugar ABC transporter permease [Streptomyces]WDI22404.1 sugar ABC transporter permease [Streptomyces enissocaesilis]MBJ6623016.1 sugar ABC transporter permease [Streptomyces sp. DHE17-7]MBQ0878768.1 sugar ABC transporter permease [Streptomyces sp. RT42]MBQ0912731.1 sugar ABC transporter permease [Streptomyces sp. RM99]MBX4175096.1 sugar ABC transporter permease [Streptomyces geysiriensis]